MTFIEGIGDEVTAFFVVAVVLILATLVTFIGGGSSFSSYPNYLPTVSVVLNTQVVDTTTNATSDSNNPSTLPRPPDPGFRDSVLPPAEDHQNTEDEPSAPHEDLDVDNELDESEIRYPDIPEADIPQEQTRSAENQPQSQSEIRVRLKYLDDTERTVMSDPKATVKDFKRTHFSEDIGNNRNVRLISCGHLLRDESTLESYHVIDNSVLHVQILQVQPESTESTQAASANDLEIGHLMYPLFALMLGVCWTAYLRFPEYFSGLSISVLALLTVGYVVVYGRF